MTYSSRKNETVVKVADCVAPGLHEQTGYQGVNHTSHPGRDHHGAELQGVPLVLPITLSQRTGMQEKEAVEHTVPEGQFVYSWRRNLCFHVAYLTAAEECKNVSDRQ